MSKPQKQLTNNPDFQKEYETLKRKHSIPKGENLGKMLATEEGRERYEKRSKKWEFFKKKWNIVFMLGNKPVVRTDKIVAKKMQIW